MTPQFFRMMMGKYYMYFGGIWGGQLQSYRNNKYNPAFKEPQAQEKALGPRVGLLSDDMKEFDEAVGEIAILDQTEHHFWPEIIPGVSLKHPGCINTMANIISLIQPEIRI